METFHYIRSYVLRQGKMTPAQRDACSRLKVGYVLPFHPGYIDWMAVFPEQEKRVIEIGFGMGVATALVAEANPETGYLGIEVHTPGVGRLLLEIEKRGIGNIRIIHHDAVPVLDSMIPPGSVDGFHVFFPDPWPKKRHHKRRLINRDFAGLLHSRLKKGGYLYVVTDWKEYADRMAEVLDSESRFVISSDGNTPVPPWRPETSFEKKGRLAEREITELYYIK